MKSGDRLVRAQHREGIARMQPDIGRRIGAGALEALREFAEDEAVGVLLHRSPDLAQTFDVLRQIAVVDMALQIRRVTPDCAGAPLHRDRRIVAQLVVVEIGVGDIEPDSRRRRASATDPEHPAPPSSPPRSASSASAAGAGICGDSAAAAPADTPRPARRTPTASCSARCRRAPDRPTHTSPISRRGFRLS